MNGSQPLNSQPYSQNLESSELNEIFLKDEADHIALIFLLQEVFQIKNQPSDEQPQLLADKFIELINIVNDLGDYVSGSTEQSIMDVFQKIHETEADIQISSEKMLMNLKPNEITRLLKEDETDSIAITFFLEEIIQIKNKKVDNELQLLNEKLIELNTIVADLGNYITPSTQQDLENTFIILRELGADDIQISLIELNFENKVTEGLAAINKEVAAYMNSQEDAYAQSQKFVRDNLPSVRTRETPKLPPITLKALSSSAVQGNPNNARSIIEQPISLASNERSLKTRSASQLSTKPPLHPKKPTFLSLSPG